MDRNFLLRGELAARLYHRCASALPVIDYHNHLSVKDIASDRKFENLTQLWIRVDPYKHRAMRILGIPEKYITGDASDYEKFKKWYSCLPGLLGNPLYDWSVMEFEQVLGMEFYPWKNPQKVWDEAKECLQELTAKQILSRFNVVYCAPCTSLTDDLSGFDRITGICPSLRGDDLVTVTADMIKKLERAAGIRISNLQEYLEATAIRMKVFTEAGCRFADHALDDGFSYAPDDGRNQERFQAVLEGKMLDGRDRDALASCLLKALTGLYAGEKYTLQLHLGAKRQTSTRLKEIAGPAGGYAAIGNGVSISALTAYLDDAEQQKAGLPEILLFNLNPSDNAAMAVLSGSFSGDGIQAKVSQGPAWWWCDHRQGMLDMLEHFSVYSVLSTFLGMTTDSRSLLSFVRHDYFRRILCDWIGEKAQQGIWPADEEMLSDLIRKICYENAARRIENIIH